MFKIATNCLRKMTEVRKTTTLSRNLTLVIRQTAYRMVFGLAKWTNQDMAEIPKVILWVETSCGYGRRLLQGISRYCHLHGPWRFYLRPPHYSQTGITRQELLEIKNWGADGAIVRKLKNDDEIIALGLPTIASPNIIEQCPHLPILHVDRVAAGKMAADHLISQGFQRFAFVGFDDMQWSRERGESFAKTVTQAAFEFHIYNGTVSQIHRSRDKEQIRLVDWLKSLPKPVGLMTCNDDRGQQVAEACNMAGIRVPEEVAIVGVDNDEVVCNLSNPPLSSVALNSERIGYEVAQLLSKLMTGEEKMVGQRLIDRPTHVVTRRSTDILAIEDPDIAAAVQFIRLSAGRIIQVDDVVEAATLSRRTLEERFRNILGRSILQEITRLRTNHLCQMLMETKMSVYQIALSMGYPSAENIARYFRREKGMSPIGYRKKYAPK